MRERTWGRPRAALGEEAASSARQCLIPSVGHPTADLVFNGKPLRRRTQKARRQREGVYFQRNGKVRATSDEAVDPQLGVPAQTKDLDLNRVHQRMKQRACRKFLIEYDHVEKSQGVHVRDLRRLEAEGTGLREEARNRDSLTAQLEDTDGVEQLRGEERPQQCLLLLG